MEQEYTPLYYQTITDLGIDPVVCGGPAPVGRASVGAPGQRGAGERAELVGEGVASAGTGVGKVARKRAPRKAVQAVQVGGDLLEKAVERTGVNGARRARLAAGTGVHRVGE